MVSNTGDIKARGRSLDILIDGVHLNDDRHFKCCCSIRMRGKLCLYNMYAFKQYTSSVKPLVIH